MKKAMTKTMTESLKIPTFGFTDEIDITSLLALRKELKITYPEVTPLAFFVKAASLAMVEHPTVNCIVGKELDSEGLI